MHNPIASYEDALKALNSVDDQADMAFKHQAVLALVRAGSLDFALAEYDRYGLGDIRHHEDIMGLGGRLYKDLYLSHTGKAAQEFARLSAAKYEEAYQDTKGYYSGINAATMSLLGGVPSEIVKTRAQRILDGLPEIDDQSDAEIYFTEASRAEAYLLLGNIHAAQAAFRRALDYDPLNYTAHASTLKQFRMIARSTGEDWPWLSEFVPPKAMHFAGHIFAREGEAEDVPVLTKAQERALFEGISSHIQENDIGFAFGALAAGVDILIAEALLEEGGELHVILPTSKKSFLKKSIEPFGKSWNRRFKACIKAASSVTIFNSEDSWPDPMLQQRASLLAMGNAIRKSHELSVQALQLLVWDGKKGQFGTAKDAATWHATGRPQLTITYPAKRNAQAHVKSSSGIQFEAILQNSKDKDAQLFPNLHDAVLAALSARSKVPNLAQSVRYDLTSPQKGSQNLKADVIHALPGAIHVCELAANYLSVFHAREYQIDFIGLGDNGNRIFVLREHG